MSSTLLTPNIIASEALMLLENNLVLGGMVYRGYEAEFDKQSNGYKPGATISIRRPQRFQARHVAVMDLTDTIMGKTTVTVNRRSGVDLSFSSEDMTLSISRFAEIHLQPALSEIAQDIDLQIGQAFYKRIWNWVGTPGQTINSPADFNVAPQRLDEMAVPVAGRVGALFPQDHWGLVNNFTGLYIQDVAKTALQKAKLPPLGDVDLYKSQSLPSHTVGDFGGTPLVRGASQNVTYLTAKDTMTQTLDTDGWSTTKTLKAGDVFTLAGVYAINPRTRVAQSYLQQFVLQNDVVTNASGAASTMLTVAPAIITSGPYQTVSAVPADNAPITMLGTANTAYNQNLVFAKQACALTVVPMEMPQAAPPGATRKTFGGLSIRLIPNYDATNDVEKWRLDVIYGVDVIYPDLATRVSGAA